MSRARLPIVPAGVRYAPALDVGDWREQAACVGWPPEIWEQDPEGGRPAPEAAWRPARQICAGCPVRGECLDDALRVERGARFGMRGGMTGDERRVEHRRRTVRARMDEAGVQR